MSFCTRRGCYSAQATVEAAVLIPVFLVLLLLLIQPGILLYDRMVMNNAASEGCRLLATKTSVLSEGADPYEEYIRARLGTIPEEDHFHVHSQGCSWDIKLAGDETTPQVSVEITNKVKPLPLLGFVAGAFSLTNAEGHFVITSKAHFIPRNEWVSSNEAGKNPSDWVAQWQ